jgi:hypothetical protein
MDEKKTTDKESDVTLVEANGDESVWSHDIENRNYYYDDSTNYEVYRPEDDDDDDDDEIDKE